MPVNSFQPSREVSEYLATVESNLRRGLATEHTHRPALETFIETLRRGVEATNEPRRIACGAPDFNLGGHDTLTGQATGNYFQVDGQPLGERNPKWLNDDYVKFIRFAQWCIEQTGYGILGFVTNHGYLDNPTFRGMRQSLMQTFDKIYIYDLRGNSKKKEKAPGGGPDENVRDIQQGVAICLMVKCEGGRQVNSESDRKQLSRRGL